MEILAKDGDLKMEIRGKHNIMIKGENEKVKEFVINMQ